MTRVLILGGGVAGLSAAHELAERGIDVEVWEASSSLGGRAKSAIVDGLPTEHGFHFFPAFYRHLHDTLRRIPNADVVKDASQLQAAIAGRPFSPQAVDDELVASSRIVIARDGKSELPFNFDLRSWGDVASMARAFSRLGLTGPEVALVMKKLTEVLVALQSGDVGVLQSVTWWDFIEADAHSKAYQEYLGNVAVRWTVAMDPKKASALTIGRIATQFWAMLATARARASDGGSPPPSAPFAQVLNGPTSEAWFDPWVKYLTSRLHVKIETQVEVTKIECPNRREVTGVEAKRGHAVIRARKGRFLGNDATLFDYCICALPIGPLSKILEVSEDLRDADPQIRKIPELKRSLNWMVGIQFFLDRDVPVARGGVMLKDSPWALTLTSQLQFWKKKEWAVAAQPAKILPPPFPASAAKEVRGVLSVIVSDWDARGHFLDRTAKSCDETQVFWEVWEELKAHLNNQPTVNDAGRETVLKDEHLIGYYLSIERRPFPESAPTTRRWYNPDSLFVDTVQAAGKRPNAKTKLRNFFLAGDYLRTYTDLATMEAANESARRAVNGILDEEKSPEARCQLWPLDIPLLAIGDAGVRRGAMAAGDIGRRIVRESTGLWSSWITSWRGQGNGE